MRFTLQGADTPHKVLQTIQAQLAQVPDQGLGYGLLRYLSPQGESPARYPQPRITFNYLGQADTQPDGSGYFQVAEAPTANRAAGNQRSEWLYIGAQVRDGQLKIAIEYSRNLHLQETIERLARDFREYLRSVVRACQTTKTTLTSSDFPLANLPQSRLEAIIARYPHLADIYPLSPMQQDILAYALGNPRSTAYHVQTSGILRGELNVDAFRRAWQVVVNRHPALRAAFWVANDTARQIILKSADLPWHEDDWRALPPSEQQERLAAHVAADLARGFELAQAPSLRLSLIRLAEDRYHFTWSQHHILSDGWSKSQILREVSTFYRAFRRHETPSLPDVPDYGDYILWLREQNLAEAETFWREMLEAWRPTLELDFQATQEPPYAEIQTTLSAETSGALQALARQQRLTVNTLIQGAWALTLGRLSAKPAVTFGMVVSGRPADLAAADSMVGLFINTLPLRVTLPVDENWLPWLQHLQTQQITVQQFAGCSSAQIRNWANLPPHVPLFESTFRFQNYPAQTSLRNWGAGLRVEQVQGVDRWPYPLNVEAVPGDRLLLRIGYQRQHFGEAVVKTILEQLADFLKAFTMKLRATS
jgi:non-ribosomal peptide synthase protein (TIGR01720 family)